MERLGAPRRIVSFVLPLGYSFNLDGSTLYLSLAAVFVAQMSNIELSLGQQLLIVLTLMLSTKGIAAVPRASLVVLAGTLAQFGLPLEGIAVDLPGLASQEPRAGIANRLAEVLAYIVMPIWVRPPAVNKAALGILFRPTRRLHHPVQRYELGNDQLTHRCPFPFNGN